MEREKAAADPAQVSRSMSDAVRRVPVMLAVAVGTTVSRALSYGAIYTTKLLRRGIDIDRPSPTHVFADLTAADAMHRFTVPFDLSRNGNTHWDWTTVTRVREPQALFANDSLAQALRQLVRYGRDGLPVIDTDARQVQGWLTNQNVLRAVGTYLADAQPNIANSRQAAEWADRGPELPTTTHAASSPATTSSNAHSGPTQLPSAVASVNSTGQLVTSPFQSSTTANSSKPTPRSGSPRGTASTSSSPPSAITTSAAPRRPATTVKRADRHVDKASSVDLAGARARSYRSPDRRGVWLQPGYCLYRVPTQVTADRKLRSL